MKHIIRCLCLLMMGLSMQTCQDPLKDVELRFIDPLPTAIELRLNPVGGTLPTPITVKLVGPDANQIVTPLNNRKFKLSEDGRLYLSLSESAKPTTKNPIRFTVVATTDSAYDVVYPVVLTSQTQRVLSEELLRRPTSVPIVQATGSADATGALKADLTAQTLSLNAGGGPTQLTVSAETQLKDAQNEAVGGTINLRMKQLDGRVLSQFPGGGILFQPLNSSGQPTPTQKLVTVVGSVRILAYNDEYQLVKSFSKPAQLTFKLNPQLINPITNRPVQAGDQIPLFSYDVTSGQWQQEAAGTIGRNAQNELQYVAAVPHLSDWVAGFTSQVCEAGPIFTISSPIPPGNLLYHCQVIDATTNLPLPNTNGNTDFYTTITNGRTLQLRNQPIGSKVKLKVYDKESQTIVTSNPVDGCSAVSVPLNLASFTKPKDLPVAVTVALQFPCTSLNEAALPTKAIYTQIRESGTSVWQDLPVMRYESGKTEFSIVTYDIKIGKTYEFRAGTLPGNYVISQEAQLISSSKWTIRLKTKEYCKQ